MFNAFIHGKPIKQEKISNFFDGGSMDQTGEITFEICRKFMQNQDISLIDENVKE